MKKALATLMLVLGIVGSIPPAGGQTSNIQIRDLMTVQQFRQAGLDKLTDQELTALDNWFQETMLELIAAVKTTNAEPLVPGTATSFSQLIGAAIVADDGQFLGVISLNQIDAKSIANEVGSHGSVVGSASIFNQVGRYGGSIGAMSPFNAISSKPPLIIKNGQFIAYLTVNTMKQPRIDPHLLIGWLKANK